MVPWEHIESVRTPDGKGEMSLHRRGQEYSIRIDGKELMNSRMHGSEEAMAELACSCLQDVDQPRVLVGGLGMGFTLAAALRCLSAGASVEVAELIPAVIAWNRGPLAALAGQPLDDPRTRVREGNIRGLFDGPRHYDAIMLDIDNGPDGMTQASNQWFYGRAGLGRMVRALKDGGVLSVWSAKEDRGFTKRLAAAGLEVKLHKVAARTRGGGPKHCVWVGRRSEEPGQAGQAG